VASRAPAANVVLYYHAIRPEQRKAFAKQMDMLLRLARPWKLDGAIEQGNSRRVAITFDDGYISVMENASPALKQRGIPFTVFVPTGSWGQRPEWVRSLNHPFWNERVVSKEELRAWAAEPLLTIGSHTVHHRNLLKATPEEASRELIDSKMELETVLGKPVNLFSFPHGAHNSRVVTQALDAGYRRIFTIEPELADASNGAPVVGRVAVEPVDWPLEFRLKALGAYRWLARRSEVNRLGVATSKIALDDSKPVAKGAALNA
jgi:peptidoglycan/xylan/chitin deacetylase (PgdA/CDA1 family)